MKNIIRPLRFAKTPKLLHQTAYSLTLIKPNPVNYNWKPSSLTNYFSYNFATHEPQHKNVIKSSYEASGYYVEQILTGCLAIYSYYIESGDECIIIDPLFDT